MDKHPHAKIYEVIVGNVGGVYRGPSEVAAYKAYREYLNLSLSGEGRAGDESVTLYEDAEPVHEHVGTLDIAIGLRDEGLSQREAVRSAKKMRLAEVVRDRVVELIETWEGEW